MQIPTGSKTLIRWIRNVDPVDPDRIENTDPVDGKSKPPPTAGGGEGEEVEEEGRLGSLTAIFPAEAICVCCEREGCEQISNLIRTSCRMAPLPSVLFKAFQRRRRKL